MRSTDLNELQNLIKSLETPKRFLHTLGVMSIAQELSIQYGADGELVKAIALLHDCAKGKEEQLLRIYGEEVKDFMPCPETLHAPLGACYAKYELKVEDSRIIEGIWYHCTGRPAMPLEEKIVFLSDAIEPGRNYKEVEKLRKLALQDLDRAVLEYLQNSLFYIEQKGYKLNPLTKEAFDYYNEKRETNG